MSAAKTEVTAHLVSLEAGDEFEDFPVESWDADTQEQPANLWEEQWEDDDHLDDDFSSVLKQELAKREQK